MKATDKIFRLLGIAFTSLGGLFLIIGIIILCKTNIMELGLFAVIGFVFSLIGVGFLISQMKKSRKRKELLQNGRRYTGKIYGYIEDKSILLNNAYPINIKVHYFDIDNIEREAIIPTGFARGSGEYPLGATIDIVALDSSYTWIEGSVRFETIEREEELMDDKPLNPTGLNLIAVECPHCGSNFTATHGYVSKCPYCGSSINC